MLNSKLNCFCVEILTGLSDTRVAINKFFQTKHFSQKILCLPIATNKKNPMFLNAFIEMWSKDWNTFENTVETISWYKYIV